MRDGGEVVFRRFAGTARQFKSAEVVFAVVLFCRGPDQRKRRAWKLLPDREILCRDCEPSEPEHVAARLCHAPGLLPGDLLDTTHTPSASTGVNNGSPCFAPLWAILRPCKAE